jgi:hypothetical protein
MQKIKVLRYHQEALKKKDKPSFTNHVIFGNKIFYNKSYMLHNINYLKIQFCALQRDEFEVFMIYMIIKEIGLPTSKTISYHCQINLVL